METTASAGSRLYGRRKGRPLRVRKARLMDDLLPKVLITLSGSERLPPHHFFDGASRRPAWMEIGFGGGEHLAKQAQLNPNIHFIGCEPFRNGVASLLDHLELGHIENVRLYDNDARLMLDALESGALEKCFVLFADPWPKKRHVERRFIGPENLTRLARVLRKKAVLRIASDDPQLVEWTRMCATAHGGFTLVYDSTTPPADWVSTRYQEKALLAGRTPIFLDYERN